MIEAAVVLSRQQEPLKWHAPAGRTSVSLPDDAGLWDFIWKNREIVGGIAHTHPGTGMPSPSREDVTTFSAIELALGRELVWWIASEDKWVIVMRDGPGKYDYGVRLPTKGLAEPSWLVPLRNLSK